MDRLDVHSRYPDVHRLPMDYHGLTWHLSILTMMFDGVHL